MFDFQDDASNREKCYTTITQLPGFVDPKQPPTKKPPFSTILGHPFVHTTEVILPEDVFSTVKESLESKIPKLQYARVFMSLSDLLEGEFFNTYIKTGAVVPCSHCNILMISEGRSGTNNLFSLRDGTLRLELGKELFERTGLTGKPIRSGGRKHAKERFLVELDLRQPSMLHGKKGFQRIAWAFENVLNHSVAWLFCDLESPMIESVPIKKHHPQIINSDPANVTHHNTLTPDFHDLDIWPNSQEENLQEDCGALSEWLSMISLDSPRISAGDSIDPYLSRYTVPETNQSKPLNLVSLNWHAFASPRWITQVFLALLRATSKADAADTWFALTSSALGKDAVEGRDGYMIFALPATGAADPGPVSEGTETVDERPAARDTRHCICWEFVGASVR